MQYDPESFKIKLRKFHSIMFWCFGVIEESSQGVDSETFWYVSKKALLNSNAWPDPKAEKYFFKNGR